MLSNRLTTTLLVAILSIVGVSLFLNRNYYYVPNSDFFAYISDAKSYASFTLPGSIKFPPIYSIFIYLTGVLIKTNHPEMVAGIGTNILLVLVFAYLLMVYSKKFIGSFSLLLIALVLSNPLLYFVALQPLNILAYTVATVAVLVLHQKRLFFYAYLLAGITFFIRQEAVALLVAMVFIDMLNRPKKITFFYSLLGFVPILTWEIIVLLHNTGGNEYLSEAIGRTSEIPNLTFINRTFWHIFAYTWPPNINTLSLLVFMNITIGFIIFLINKKGEQILLFTYLFLYTVIHVLFPDTAERYTFPVLWIVYIYSLWPLFFSENVSGKKAGIVHSFLRILFCLLSAYLIINNIAHIKNHEGQRYGRTETRLIGEWLSSARFSKLTYVITLEPWIVAYYTKNPLVEFFYLPSFCVSLDCIKIPFNQNQYETLLVVDSYTEGESGYFARKFGAILFQTILNSPDAFRLHYITTLRRNGAWARLYLLQQSPPKNDQ